MTFDQVPVSDRSTMVSRRLVRLLATAAVLLALAVLAALRWNEVRTTAIELQCCAKRNGLAVECSRLYRTSGDKRAAVWRANSVLAESGLLLLPREDELQAFDGCVDTWDEVSYSSCFFLTAFVPENVGAMSCRVSLEENILREVDLPLPTGQILHLKFKLLHDVETNSMRAVILSEKLPGGSINLGLVVQGKCEPRGMHVNYSGLYMKLPPEKADPFMARVEHGEGHRRLDDESQVLWPPENHELMHAGWSLDSLPDEGSWAGIAVILKSSHPARARDDGDFAALNAANVLPPRLHPSQLRGARPSDHPYYAELSPPVTQPATAFSDGR